MRYVWYALLAYLLYRFIFGFLLPVFRTTRQVKKQFRDMQEKMNDFARQREEVFQQQPKEDPKKQQKAPPGDYIDFEDVK
jgi:hypothetical protein